MYNRKCRCSNIEAIRDPSVDIPANVTENTYHLRFHQHLIEATGIGPEQLGEVFLSALD